jgi:hypothetical protein
MAGCCEHGNDLFTQSVLLSSTHKSYFQLLHEASFYTPTCCHFLLYPSLASYNIIKAHGVYHMSVDWKRIYVSFL